MENRNTGRTRMDGEQEYRENKNRWRTGIQREQE